MSDNNEQDTNAVASVTPELENKIHSDGITATVVLGGQAKEIKKLKAGNFYKAQQAFVDIYSTFMGFTKGSNINPGEIDPNDVDKLAEIAKNTDISTMQEMMTQAPQKIAKFVAICAGMTEEELYEEAYPDEINEAFRVCYELNNVMANLKKLAAPMQGLNKD